MVPIADDMIVYVQNPKGSTEEKKRKKKNHQTPRISEFTMVAGYKMNTQKISNI